MKLCIRISQSESGEYIALCPSLPGCVSRGQTRDEAAGKLDEAIRGYLAAMSNFVPDRLDHEILEAQTA